MKTSIKRDDLLSTQQIAMKKTNKAIELVLSKYNTEWIGNEGDVDQNEMNKNDSDIYSYLFDAREMIQNIQTQIINL
ncbi:hypothetical protein [Methyloprofundus sp.]|uniref:hypothetical protein n=1 Tax=Methyloprofundus sp. TaxID=2020875 RepID=UPI003D13CD57